MAKCGRIQRGEIPVIHICHSFMRTRAEQIVNHLLLLRQLTRRLEWITTENDPPRQSGVLAEKILLNLARNPQPFLNPDFIQTILSLKPPLSVIAEHDRLALRKTALVAEEGLPSAVE